LGSQATFFVVFFLAGLLAFFLVLLASLAPLAPLAPAAPPFSGLDAFFLTVFFFAVVFFLVGRGAQAAMP